MHYFFQVLIGGSNTIPDSLLFDISLAREKNVAAHSCSGIDPSVDFFLYSLYDKIMHFPFIVVASIHAVSSLSKTSLTEINSRYLLLINSCCLINHLISTFAEFPCSDC